MHPRAGRLVFVQTVVPDYRVPLFETLGHLLEGRLQVLTGMSDYGPATRSADALPASIARVENRFLLGRRLLWQRLPWRAVYRADVVLADLNPRNLSTWAILLLRGLAGRRTVLWGHAWPRAGRGARTDRLRGGQRRLASALVLYTEQQRRELRQMMPPSTALYAAPNALYRAADLRPAAPSDGRPSSFLCVGRLIPEKKPRLLVEAFARAADAGLPADCRLVLAGDGPERPALEGLCRARGIADRVELAGHVPPDALRPYYGDAIASVSPGYVGLSLTQSLGFGIPMIYGLDEPHAPEIEAALDGVNARSFPSDDAEALARTLVEFAQERAQWLERRDGIARWTAERYSLEAMCERIAAAAFGEPRER